MALRCKDLTLKLVDLHNVSIIDSLSELLDKENLADSFYLGRPVTGRAIMQRMLTPSHSLGNQEPWPFYIATRHSSDSPIGMVAVINGFLSYYVAHSARRQGVGSILVGHISSIAAAELKLSKLRALVMQNNIYSRRILERHLFSFRGFETKFCQQSGMTVTLLSYHRSCM